MMVVYIYGVGDGCGQISLDTAAASTTVGWRNECVCVCLCVMRFPHQEMLVGHRLGWFTCVRDESTIVPERCARGKWNTHHLQCSGGLLADVQPARQSEVHPECIVPNCVRIYTQASPIYSVQLSVCIYVWRSIVYISVWTRDASCARNGEGKRWN